MEVSYAIKVKRHRPSSTAQTALQFSIVWYSDKDVHTGFTQADQAIPVY